MNCARAAGLLALGLAMSAGGEQSLAPRKPIAHLGGFESTSDVRFVAEPDRAHRLIATYIFPDRARWYLCLAGGAESERTLHFQSGARWFAYDDASAKSRELAGAERSQIEHFFVVRRALFLWPDGFEWKVDGDLRRARLDSESSLVATLGSDGRPTSIAWRGADEHELEALVDVQWRAAKERSFPSSLALAREGSIAWRETIASVETQVDYLDEFFTPADRRAKPALSSDGSIEVRRIELAASTLKRIEFAKPDSHDDVDRAKARTRMRLEEESARRVASGELAKRSRTLDSAVCFELSDDARWTAIRLRANERFEDPPPPWSNVDAGPALTVRLPSIDRLTPALIAGVRERVPEGWRAASPYVRIEAGPDHDAVQLILPLTAVAH